MRQSKQIKKEEESTPVAELVAEAIASNPNSRSLKQAFTSGGSHGRLKKNPESDWTLDIPHVQKEESPAIDLPKREQGCIPCINPDCTLSLINTSKLQDCIQTNMQCKICSSDLTMTQQSVALATTLVFTCKRGHQSKVAPDPCPSYFEQTSTASSNRVREKASWYKPNVAFVLGLLASGCGGTKSSIIGSFLGLPGSQYFGQNHFAAIEDEVGPFLRQVAEHSMDEALKMEVKKCQ